GVFFARGIGGIWVKLRGLKNNFIYFTHLSQSRNWVCAHPTDPGLPLFVQFAKMRKSCRKILRRFQ
ncbi:MAG: hypothetical protein FWE95_10295, partial [Planctomycetaceae bacterium]|nr:hypothetical protein [Planctomycetaceae bacterium]